MNASRRPFEKHPDDLIAHLRALAATRPADTALIVVTAETETRFSYAELDRRVRAVAADLQARFEPGDRALLLLDNNEHYVVGFLACLYAGLIAVPAFPPESLREHHVTRLMTIAWDAQARCVLVSSDLLEVVENAGDLLKDMDRLVVDASMTGDADRWQPRTCGERDIIFLQYTSGSTAAPKGVIVDHGNLLANEQVINRALQMDPADVFVSWLPLFHDMGLVGGLFQPIYSGIPLVLMSPACFLERPARWLELISRHRGTVSGGPDFAYRLCLERVSDAQLKTLDLSSWRVAFSGAEPVRYDTLRAFAERFAAAGFDARAIYPCYGLAEATLFVTGGYRSGGMTVRTFSSERLAKGRAVTSRIGTTLVACGVAHGRHRVRIVDPATGARQSNTQIGEIWVNGPSVSRGYWRRDAETKQTFVEHDGKRWLRTGDLGFVQHKQLYITGRQKDLIILRGHNVYPQDIEQAIEIRTEAVRKGRVAVFSVPTAAGEGVGLAVEVSRSLQKLVPPERLVDELSLVVSQLCRESLAVAVLLNPGALPKTSSGKVQRSACRDAWHRGVLDAFAIYENGRFTLGGSSPERTPAAMDDVERALGELWRDVLKRDELPTRDSSFILDGGNSLSAVQLAAAIGERWHIDVPVSKVFERPRLREIAAEIKLALRGGGRAENDIAALSIDQRRKPLPASHSQSQQWLLAQMNPASAAYHVAVGLRLCGQLNTEALRSSLQALIDRHESLRSCFTTSSKGDVEQSIRPTVQLSFPRIDLRDMPSATRSVKADEEIEKIVRAPFDLTEAPLFRACLIQLADDEHVLAMVMHHIAGDGWSARILLDEMAQLYAAKCEGGEPQLRPLPVQYADFAQWQRSWLASSARDRQLSYWREQLGNEHPALQLPVDYPRGASRRHRAARHSFELPVSLVEGLRQRAHQGEATLFMILLAGLQALLHRYTGQNDIRVGVPVANRNRPETHRIVGLFVNTQVLRSEIDGRLPLAKLLEQVRRAAIGAQEHQELPFDQLVESLQPARGTDHHPIFQVMMNHQPALPVPQLPGLGVERYDIDEPGAPFDLILRTTEQAAGSVAAALVYAADSFAPGTITRLGQHLEAMLHVLAHQPALTVGEVSLRDEASPALPVASNERSFEPAHLRIARLAARLGDRPALHCDGVTLSYRELDRWSDQIAATLLAVNVGPDARVGLCVERSVAMVAGLLGIWKSGGAFVPLDPTYPTERLSYMRADSQLRAVVIDAASASRCGEALASCPQVRVDAMTDSTAQPLPAIALHADRLAYVIYTSGSTGLPKGVAVSHRSLALHLDDFIAHYRIVDGDKLLHSSTINFDVALHELLPALMVGGQVQMRGPQMWTLDGLSRTLRDENVTFARIPTAFWQQWLRALPSSLPQLRQITVGGEALPGDALARWFAGPLRAIPVDNLYGPTETTVACVAHRCAEADAELHTVPIGKPYASRDAYVLDPDGNIAPMGGIGELCIAGGTLARGYLGRPALTAERFIANPEGAGGRLYRTGDLCRERAGGIVEYLGRLDQQVKLRGHRIELGEVEAALRRCANVREAVVEPRGDGELRQLVGYVVGDVESAALRAELLDRLPDYMVPAAFVVMAQLPMNPNGKVDRKALPAPVLAERSGFEAPQGSEESVLAAVWADALNVDRVGRHDNFFDLGGHSLLLLKVHAQLQSRLQSPPSIVDLFKYPTVNGLAAFLQSGEQQRSHQQTAERGMRQRRAFLPARPSVERAPS